MTKSITWLHLSDIHLGSPSEAHWRGKALNALFSTIERESQGEWRPDLVFFTGDLGYSGKSPEYFPEGSIDDYDAQRFFDRILDAAGLADLKKERLFIVPGNHDINRDVARKIILPKDQAHDDWITKFVNSEEPFYHEASDKFFRDAACLNAFLHKFQEFQRFLYSYLGQKFREDKPYLLAVVELREITIGIMGFNTAWLAGDNEKTYSQLLGLLPLDLAINELGKSKIDLTFAVFHHPCDELNQYERYVIRQRLTLIADFVLCGHLDNPDLPNLQSTKSKRVPFVQVGPTYGGPRFPNRFYFARYEIERNEGWITFHPFRYSDTNFSWLPDVEMTESIKERHGSEVLKLWPVVESRRRTVPLITEAPAYFKDRREQLLRLDEWYESGVPLAAVIGLSGVGKTWLVRKWLTQRRDADSGFTYRAIEASPLFLSEDDNPDKFAAQVLERISELCEIEPISVTEVLAEDLATKTRASNQVLIVDHAEHLCQKRGAKGNVGRLAATFRDFLAALVKIPFGPGRMILLSSLRPSDLVEKELIDRRYVAVIGSQRDPWQIMGLPEEDAVPFLSGLLGPDHGFEYESLVKVVQRFGGHPMALRWFSMTNREDQEKILKKELREGLPFVELYGLLRDVVRNCSAEEVDLLKIICILKQAEQPDFFGTIRPALGIQIIHECLDTLRRRCLVEYGLVRRTGFNAHSIVKEWGRQVYATELTELHRLVASEYSNRDDALPAAHHFEKAGDHEQAKEWRNEYTRRNLKEGRQAYFDGDFARAREHSTQFIEEIHQLHQTVANHRYLSYAYLNRAVSQHKESFNWEAERDDLRKALEEWEDNERALTFYVAVLGEALRRRQPWRDVNAELEHVVPLAEKVANRSGAVSLAMLALLRLLSFWGQQTPDGTRRGIICEKLAQLIDLHLGSTKRKLLKDEAFEAYMRALSFLARMRDGGDRKQYISDAIDLADRSELISSSAELLLTRANVYYLRARFASDASERLEGLKKTQDVLTSIHDSVALPSGFARLFSMAVLDSARLESQNEAIRQIEKGLEELEALRTRTLSTTDRDSEFDSAIIRLQLQAAELTLENREKYLLPALSIVRGALTTGTRLTPELADCAIRAFIEGAQESVSAGTPPEDETQERMALSETMRVSRIEIRELDRAIQAAERVMPSPLFAILRLRLRVQYLRTNWTIGDPTEPKMVQEVIERAKRLSTEFEGEPLVWLELVELWKIVAQRTCAKDRFDQAVLEADTAFVRLSSCVTRNKYLLREARFLRVIMDYGSARRVLGTYLSEANSAHERFAACNLLLDVVAHSIHWNVGDAPSLLEDAKIASELYEEYLTYLGIKQEDESDRGTARRILCWLRCASYAGLVDQGDLSWVDDIYQNVHFGGGVTNVQILGSLRRSPDRLARILGNHILDGTMWRETATYLSTRFGRDPKHAEEAFRFWTISKWWLENALRWEGKWRGKISGTLADLNLARALLRHPPGSDSWREGEAKLKELYSKQMPWVYKRFVVQLWEQIQESSGTSL